MKDPFGRTIDYLRVSVTDRCNFRCVYCMPQQGFPVLPKPHLLSFEEIERIVGVAARLGVRKVRITGGEPLVRKELPSLIRMLSHTPGIEDLSMTTNAYILAPMAEELKRAGLHRVNISLDTLDADKFTRLARRGDLRRVLEGVRAAQEVGLSPVKLNAVAMRGWNDCEAPAFAEWTTREPVHFRYIELMPIKWSTDETRDFDPFAPHGGQGLLRLNEVDGDMLSDLDLRKLYVPWQELKARIEAELGLLEPAEVKTNGPARTFRVPGAPGTIGFISQISDDLCRGCNRLRLTADGFLRPCLMSDGELDLKTPMREGCSDDDLAELIQHVVAHKPERHYLAEGQQPVGRGMSQIGG